MMRWDGGLGSIDMRWCWPIHDQADRHVPDVGHPGAFGAKRRYDVHTGVDLYTPEGSLVRAVYGGVVLTKGLFTGDGDSGWWNKTYYVMVNHVHCVVVYGEIEPLDVKRGDIVTKGQALGKVLRVLKKDKGKPTSMLHIEMYENKWDSEPVWWKHDQEKPDDLMDPTEWLKEASTEEVFETHNE